MAKPTREEIQAAYDALEEFYYAACALNLHGSHDSEEEWHSAILKVLPPKPRPTMADLEWDDDAHYLAEAEHADWGKGIMISCECYGTIRCVIEGEIYLAKCEDLTPTGKRYTLTEVQE